MPLYVFCGERLLVSYLRPSKIDGAKHSWAIQALLIKWLHRPWPEVEIMVRGDFGFCRWRMVRVWDTARRVIVKAEHGARGGNPRFVVTSLEHNPQRVYDRICCARGDMENRIKEQQLDLFVDPTSVPQMVGQPVPPTAVEPSLHVAGDDPPHRVARHGAGARNVAPCA